MGSRGRSEGPASEDAVTPHSRRGDGPEHDLPRVLLACPGLDHVQRGFETFARECYEALRGRDDVAIELAKVSGVRRREEIMLRVPTRDAALVRALARRWGREPFVVEHVAFAVALIPIILLRRPNVLYFSEWHVGRVLSAWRRATGGGFRLVFCNGALAADGYGHLDVVQQLVPGAIEYAAARGEPTDKQVLLPLGATIERSLQIPADRRALRVFLDLPVDRQIVLSAGALTAHPKRMDFMIEELALMEEPRPYLLLLGHPEQDTPAIRRLAAERLGPRGHDIRTVSPEQMRQYYQASDAFVLASLWESFGRVLVEAQSQGLPCLAHDYPVMKWVLGEEGDTTDLTKPGAVVTWLRSLTADDLSSERRKRRHRHAYERFSWDVLADRYVEMLTMAAG